MPRGEGGLKCSGLQLILSLFIIVSWSQSLTHFWKVPLHIPVPWSEMISNAKTFKAPHKYRADHNWWYLHFASNPDEISTDRRSGSLVDCTSVPPIKSNKLGSTRRYLSYHSILCRYHPELPRQPQVARIKNSRITSRANKQLLHKRLSINCWEHWAL